MENGETVNCSMHTSAARTLEQHVACISTKVNSPATTRAFTHTTTQEVAEGTVAILPGVFGKQTTYMHSTNGKQTGCWKPLKDLWESLMRYCAILTVAWCELSMAKTHTSPPADVRSSTGRVCVYAK